MAFATPAMGDMNFVAGYQKSDLGTLPLGIELAFVTKNVLAAHIKALSAGAVPIAVPRQKSWGRTVAYVCDTDGVIADSCSPM